MYRYILKRFLYMLPVLLFVSAVVFALMYVAPGDPASIILGTDSTPERVTVLRHQMGLDRPFIVQLGLYVKNLVLHFDLGISYRTKTPVIYEILSRLPITITLTLFSMAIGIVFGIAAGVISAVKQYSWTDKITTVIALSGISMPSFWLALMAVLIFGVKLRWFPVSGSYGFMYWVLPTCTLGLQAAGIIMRMTRSSMLEVIRQDYIRTARAKGQTEWVVIMRHGLKNALIPIITTIGLQTGYLIGGAVLVEAVFSMPGLGKYLLEGINNLDYPAVQGTVLIIAFMYIVIMLIVDIVYGFVDPRIKSIYSTAKRKAA